LNKNHNKGETQAFVLVYCDCKEEGIKIQNKNPNKWKINPCVFSEYDSKE